MAIKMSLFKISKPYPVKTKSDENEQFYQMLIYYILCKEIPFKNISTSKNHGDIF